MRSEEGCVSAVRRCSVDECSAYLLDEIDEAADTIRRHRALHSEDGEASGQGEYRQLSQFWCSTHHWSLTRPT